MLTYVEQVQREVGQPSQSTSTTVLLDSEEDSGFYSFLLKPDQSSSSLADQVTKLL